MGISASVKTGKPVLAANVTAPDVPVKPGMLAYTGDFTHICEVLHDSGYTGVELITTSPETLDISKLDEITKNNSLKMTAFNSGPLCGLLGLTFTDPDENVRAEAMKKLSSMIRLAGRYGAPVNIGIVRGKYLPGVERKKTYGLAVEALRMLSSQAFEEGVRLVIETVNASMTNFINTLEDAAGLIRDVNEPALCVMYDILQMDIEEKDLLRSAEEYLSICGHVHLCGKNRAVPGTDEMPVESFVNVLKKGGYSGAYSVEINPDPDPEEIHRKAAGYLLRFL